MTLIEMDEGCALSFPLDVCDTDKFQIDMYADDIIYEMTICRAETLQEFFEYNTGNIQEFWYYQSDGFTLIPYYETIREDKIKCVDIWINDLRIDQYVIHEAHDYVQPSAQKVVKINYI